jgi:hypothetical protein
MSMFDEHFYKLIILLTYMYFLLNVVVCHVRVARAFY